MSQVVVVTRPEPDASDYADELRLAGIEAFVEPMLKLEGLDFTVPDLSDYSGLLVTSANALRFYDEGGAVVPDIPVYCVGKFTAQAAREIGFERVVSVDGTGEDLFSYVKMLPDSSLQKFLHICGASVAFPLVKALSDHGVEAEELPVYHSIMSGQFSQGFCNVLKSGDIKAVTFFSKRTAEAFVACARECESESLFSAIKALSISDGVLECVRVLQWAGCYASKTPDREGMMTLLKMYA